MQHIATLIGFLLIALGGWAYFFPIGDRSPTALIPAAFGLPILLLGVLAHKDNLRKHAMHGAAAIGLIGFLGGAVMTGKALLSGGTLDELAQRKVLVQGLTAAICLVFVGLCVKSFIDARRRREAAVLNKPPV